jgi:hypothetical protein
VQGLRVVVGMALVLRKSFDEPPSTM